MAGSGDLRSTGASVVNSLSSGGSSSGQDGRPSVAPPRLRSVTSTPDRCRRFLLRSESGAWGGGSGALLGLRPGAVPTAGFGIKSERARRRSSTTGFRSPLAEAVRKTAEEQIGGAQAERTAEERNSSNGVRFNLKSLLSASRAFVSTHLFVGAFCLRFLDC